MKLWEIVVSVLFVCALSVGGALFYYENNKSPITQVRVVAAPEQAQAPTKPNVLGLWQDVNTAREQNGLSALTLSSKLDQSAQDKCNDMVKKNYWAHNAPDGTLWYKFIQKHTTYTAAAENLAYGFQDSQSTVTGWLNSPEHKVNIMNPVYHNEGFGICHSADFVGVGQETIVVEHFTN